MKLNFKFVQTDLKKLANDILKKVFNKEEMNLYVMSLRNDIVKRTRLGSGVRDNLKKKQKLKRLTSKKYVKLRSSSSELSDLTKPSKSNLTFSGQLLDSLTPISNKAFEGSIKIKETRKKLKHQKTIINNSKIIEYQEVQGRPFFYVTDLENKRLEQMMKKKLKKYLRQGKF